MTYKNKGEGNTLIDTYRRRPERNLLTCFINCSGYSASVKG